MRNPPANSPYAPDAPDEDTESDDYEPDFAAIRERRQEALLEEPW